MTYPEWSSKADNLVVIGGALRKEDSFLTLIITNFLHHPSWEKRRIIIADPCADDIRERLMNYWGVNVSDQLVCVNVYLQDSVKELVKLIGKRAKTKARAATRSPRF